MNGDTQMQPVDKFQLGKKWFWMGIVVATLNILAGLIYGLVLIFEKDHKKEGIIIVCWAIVWALIGFFLIGPWLVKSDWMPKFQVVK